MTPSAIAQLTDRRLKQQFADFLGVYLFGSQVRGEATASSDIDMVLLFRNKPLWREKNRILDQIAEVEIETQSVIDAKIYSDEELKNTYTPFRQSVLEEGIFYAA